MADIKIGATLPGEAVIVELMKTIQMVVEGQPPEVKAKLWEWYIKDMVAWRKLWGLDA